MRIKIGLIFSLVLANYLAIGQATNDKFKNTAFEDSEIRYTSNSPKDIRLMEPATIRKSEFFSEYKKAFGLSDDYDFRPLSTGAEKSASHHVRYQQYFKGIEVAETHYILHTKQDLVYHANGNTVHGLEINSQPTLNLEQAEFFLAKHFTDYVTGNKINKKLSGNSPYADLAEPRLVISAGTSERRAENFHLVYRFDIFTSHPLGRYDVDIDAHTGELVGKLPRFYDDNIHTRGVSLYNDTVDIVVMDTSFASEWDPSSWHLNDWNAYGGGGLSWWIADTLIGTNGGYRDSWFQTLTTDPIIIAGGNPTLSFYHRYSTELPQDYEEFDAWDGMNVQISTDGGETWTVLTNPTPAYDKTSLFSFDFHGKGSNVPGWCGLHPEWTQVTFSLLEYAGTTVNIRFVFASDGALSGIDEPGLFGWQIDQIQVNSVYSNEGTPENISSNNMTSSYVSFIEGNYRLRETTRGLGIATFNAKNVTDFNGDATDFVEDDSLFFAEENASGVSLHWALEETYDYYLEKFGRESFDGKSGMIRAYTDMVFDDGPNNASYIGGGMMLFGAGDGINFGPLVSVDVVSHELTHGVTGSSAGLVYMNQSGALNESFSDIFGKAIEFHVDGAMGSWWLGEDFAINASPFRSMSNPKLRFDPDTYMGQYWVPTDGSVEADNGGVHTNSGVQNYWFYLLCEGGSGTNDDDYYYEVTPIGLAAAEKIAYRNLTSYLVPSSGYVDAANYSIESAIDLFGAVSQEVTSVKEAWGAVGIYMIPKINVPETIEIQSASQGETAIALLTISNKSSVPLEISALSVSGNGFSIVGPPKLPLNIEKDYQLQIGYTGEINNTELGTISISSNDPDNSIVTVDLYGMGFNDLDPLSNKSVALLEPAYPNPVKESAYIPFSLAKPSHINITLLNSKGELINILSDGEFTEGQHLIEWDGTDSNSIRVPSGTYFIVLSLENQKYTQSLTVF